MDLHQLLPGEPPDRQEGTGETLVEVLSLSTRVKQQFPRSSWPMSLYPGASR